MILQAIPSQNPRFLMGPNNMQFFNRQSSFVKKIILTAMTAVLILSGSVLQSRILKVEASPDVLLVSHTAIPFGTVFPGEVLDETYTVSLDTSVDDDEYQTALEPLEGVLDLCPFLEVIAIDDPDEGDTFAAALLARPGDEIDSWQVRLTVPGIEGQIAQDHDGDIVVTGGDYGCKIIITTDTEAGPRLAIEKSGVFNEVNNHIVYTIDWEITGEGLIEDVFITDELPFGTLFVAATPPGTYSTTTDSVTWELGDIVAPDAGSVSFEVDSFFDVFYDDVLNFLPGSSAPGAIRVLDATIDSPVPPDLEGAAFPVIGVPDLSDTDGKFVNTLFAGDFGAGIETKTVDDEAQTFVALGDGGKIVIDTTAGTPLVNSVGTDFVLFETPNTGGKDPACVSATAVDDTVYPLGVSAACGGAKEFKFQATGDAPGSGVPINLDSLGVPADTAIKSITIHDIFDGHALGSTGSSGYDLDAIIGRSPVCEIDNTATISATGFDPVESSFTVFVPNSECEEIELFSLAGPPGDTGSDGEGGGSGGGDGGVSGFGQVSGGASGASGSSSSGGSSSNPTPPSLPQVLDEGGIVAGVTELPRTGLPPAILLIALFALSIMLKSRALFLPGKFQDEVT